MKMKYTFTLYVFLIALVFFTAFFFTGAPGYCETKVPDKIVVYEAVLKYCSLWDEKESGDLANYAYDDAADYAKEAAVKLLDEKLTEKSEAYQVLVKISEGVSAMFTAMAEADKEFLRKAKIDNNTMRKNAKIMASTAKYLAAAGPAKGALALKCLLAALLFTINNDEAHTGIPVKYTSTGGVLVNRLVSISCQNILCQTLIKVLASAEFEEKALTSLYKTIDFIEKKRPPFALAIEEARVETVKIIEDVALLDPGRFSGPDSAPLFPPGAYRAMSAEIKKSPFALKLVRLYADEGIRQIGEVFSALAKSFDMPFAQARAILDEQDRKFFDHKYNNLLAQLSAPNIVRLHEQVVKNQVCMDFVKLYACLKLHKLISKTFPAKLEDAARSASITLPPDRFSGKSYEYRLNSSGGFAVVSPGPDLKISVKPEGIADILSGREFKAPDDLILTETGSRIR
jgi:hypothetical protein